MKHRNKGIRRPMKDVADQETLGADVRLAAIADQIASLQKHYLLQADGRSTRAVIVGLVDLAFKLRASKNAGFRAKALILIAANECGIAWSDGLDETNEFRLVGLTALEAFAIGLAKEVIAGDQT